MSRVVPVTFCAANNVLLSRASCHQPRGMERREEVGGIMVDTSFYRKGRSQSRVESGET